MVLIVLEALLALGLAVFIVWWTMFSGRRRGEVVRDDEVSAPSPDDTPPANRG